MECHNRGAGTAVTGDLHETEILDQTRITGWRAAALVLGPAFFLPCLNMLQGQTGIFEPFAHLNDGDLATITAVSNLICLSWHAVAFLLILWAVREALAFPRHVAMATGGDAFRCVVQLLGDLLLVPVFAVLPAETPLLSYLPTKRNQRILADCPSLHLFKQAPHLRNQWLCFALIMWRDLRGSQFTQFVRRECIHTPDGGIFALDWWEEPVQVPANKVLFIASIWTGDAVVSATRETCRYFSRRGWRCVVMVKRGCGLSMPVQQPEGSPEKREPHPWCLGGFDDISLAIDHVAAACPDMPLCGLGCSLGAAQMRNYTARTKGHSKLQAVVLADGGEDWEVCLYDIDKRLPLVSKSLRLAATHTLRLCHCTPSEQSQEEKLTDAGEPPLLRGGLVEMVRDMMGPAHGFQQTQQGVRRYLRSCQPADPAGCSIPCLELFSFNDTLTDVPMVKDLLQLYRASPHIITCATRGGTHIARWDGWRAQCWLSRVASEFLEAAMATPSSMQEEDLCKGA